MEALCGVLNHALNNLPVFLEMQEGREGGWQLLLQKQEQSNNTFILQYIKQPGNMTRNLNIFHDVVLSESMKSLSCLRCCC